MLSNEKLEVLKKEWSEFYFKSIILEEENVVFNTLDYEEDGSFEDIKFSLEKRLVYEFIDYFREYGEELEEEMHKFTDEYFAKNYKGIDRVIELQWLSYMSKKK